ncbi:MAG: hypothetical protein ABFD85_10295 [Phycisphaerae bacterium]
MKIEQLRDMLASLAQQHPKAEVFVVYPARHAGRPTTKRGRIESYRTHLSSHGFIEPMVMLEVDYANAENLPHD